MMKLKSFDDKESEIVVRHILEFKELVKGYEKLLMAIGRL